MKIKKNLPNFHLFRRFPSKKLPFSQGSAIRLLALCILCGFILFQLGRIFVIKRPLPKNFPVFPQNLKKRIHPEKMFRKKAIKPAYYIVISGEELGYLEPCGCSDGLLGGIQRKDSILSFLKRRGQKVFLFGVGDLEDKGGPLGKIKSQFLIKAMESMKIHGLSLGEWELAKLAFWQKKQELPWVATNLLLKTPWKAKKVKNLQEKHFTLYFFSLLSSEFKTLADLNGVEFLSPSKALPLNLSKTSKNQGRTRLEMVVFHGKWEEMEELASSFPQVEIWINVNRYALPKIIIQKRKNGRKQWLLKNSRKGKHLFVCALDQRGNILQVNSIALDDHIPDSPSMTLLYQQYIRKVRESGLSLRLANQWQTEGGIYVGSQQCIQCHPQEGAQWKETRHYHSFETLRNKGQHKNPECLFCHTIGYGFVSGFQSEDLTANLKNVGCESCHGVGSRHVQRPERGYGKVKKKTCLSCHTLENSPHFDFKKYLPKVLHKK